MRTRPLILSLFVAVLLSVSGCGYNRIQELDEQTKASWSEVLNQYKRRADLIPNLVNVVKGYAAHEEKVLREVTEARSRVGSMTLSPEMLANEEAVKRFQAAQADMTSALSRLIAVSENYPNLKADQNFRDLQTQLEGTENRITVARGNYVRAVQEFNSLVRKFPAVVTAKVFGYGPKAQFSVEDERAVAEPPKVEM